MCAPVLVDPGAVCQVLLQLVLSSEGPATGGASEGFGAGMNEEVLVQVTLLTEHLVTLQTHVIFNTSSGGV